jgi:murein DD-endopeptidase MepM/ murein hydrolase activator NlpD
MMRSFGVFFLLLFLCTTVFADIYTVQSGDTLSGLLAEEYTMEEAAAIARELKAQVPEYVLRPGMEVERDRGMFLIKLSVSKEARIYRDEKIPRVAVVKHEELVMPTLVKGTITSSLFATVQEIGENVELAANLARMYEWEFDFFRDIHPGDKFTVLVEKLFVNGRYAGYGRILAADFFVQGKHKKAFYFNDNGKYGYFNEKGLALERGFLRVPLSYARITSRFTNSRMHPVLKEVRPHYGVDYAAPKGTPVMATASGAVLRATYATGNGNYIELLHSNGYKTYYLHLNGFNRTVHAGAKVSRGQVIGYVGSTGYSTGPHLDYRISHNGRWLNPVSFVADPPKLTEKTKGEFLAEVVAKYEPTLMAADQYAGIFKQGYMP